MESLIQPIAILCLAWSLGDAMGALGLSEFVVSGLSGNLPIECLAALVFVLASAIAFSTGSSWGAMAILFPLVMPLAWSLGEGIVINRSCQSLLYCIERCTAPVLN